MVDWNKHALAMQYSRDGDDSKALEIFAELLHDAETDSDKRAILLGQASCYSRRFELDKSLELIAQAKMLAGAQRHFLLQVARGEASVHALQRRFDLACGEYALIRTEYRDLLEEDQDSAMDVDSRFACTLVDARRYRESIPIFRNLFKREQPEDLQRLQLWFGIALAGVGDRMEGQQFLFAAAKGSDPLLAECARAPHCAHKGITGCRPLRRTLLVEAFPSQH